MKLNQRGLIAQVGIGALAVLAIAAVGAIIALPIYYVKGTEEQVTITIKKTERIVQRGGNDAKYLVFTDSEVFEDTDSILNGKFNSSDLYGQLENGKTYNCKVYGYRMPFFSSYRNLVKCDPVATDRPLNQ